MNYLDNMRININCPELGFKGQWMDVNMRFPEEEDGTEDIDVMENRQGGELLFNFRPTGYSLDRRCRTTIGGFCTTSKGEDYMKAVFYRACLMIFYPPRKEDSFKPLAADNQTAG